MNVNYRPGRKGDCRRIAELDYMASSGAAEFLFHDLVPNATAVDIISSQLQQDIYPYTYRSAIVAKIDQQVIAMALSFPAEFHGIDANMKEFFPAERLQHFREFFSTRVQGSYYIDAIATDVKFRSYGIGQELLQRTRNKAIDEGYDRLSLIVFADNTRAIEFYRRHDFEYVRAIQLNPHELIPHEDGCLLLQQV